VSKFALEAFGALSMAEEFTDNGLGVNPWGDLGLFDGYGEEGIELSLSLFFELLLILGGGLSILEALFFVTNLLLFF